MNLDLHFNRFLICRPDRLGDVTLSTPFASILKTAYPACEVNYLVKENAAAVFTNNPHVDRVIYFETKDKKLDTISSLVSQIRPLRITHAFQLIPNELINYALFLSGIPYRSGVGHKFFQFITNTKSVYRQNYEQRRNETDYCLDHLRKIGIMIENPSTEIYLSEEEKAQVKNKRKELLRGKRALVGVHATSGKSAPNLPLSEYRQLVEALVKMGDLAVMCTEKETPDDLKGIDGVDYSNEGTSLRESIVNYAALDWLISASTGPMHVSAALGVKTLSVFCPLPACEPALWGPFNSNAKFVLPEANYCAKICSGVPSSCDFSGEGGISHKKILDNLLLYLG